MSPNVVPSRTSNETSCRAHSSSARERAVRTRCLSDDGFCLYSRKRLLTPSISIASTVDARAFSLVIGAVRVASRLSHPMTRGLDGERRRRRANPGPCDGEPRVVGRGRAELGGARSDLVGGRAALGIWSVPESELGLLPDDLAG